MRLKAPARPESTRPWDTSDRSGVLAEAGTVDGDALLTASLDLTRLETYHSAYFSDTNPALYRKYFPKIYEGSQ
jgi:hypothetical protein